MEYKNLLTLVRNLLLAYCVYMLCRVTFLIENWGLYSDSWQQTHYGQLLSGSLLYDTSAIAYTLAVYIVMMLLPFPFRYSRVWQRICRWFFVVIGALAVVANLVDAVYSQYTGRRTTSSFFSEFSNDSNLTGIIGVELVRHWYLVLVGVAFIALLWLLYRESHIDRPTSGSRVRRYTVSTLYLLAAIPLCFIGTRGGATHHRPISIADASQYVGRPQEVNLVLNTPFCMIRTVGKATFHNPSYFSADELGKYYNPIHNPAVDSTAISSDTTVKRNVVILILESFGTEYFGYYNRNEKDYPGYTPFLDSLASISLTFDHSFANGRKSIDAMPSILSSIPMFVEPYVLTRYSNNKRTSIAGLLAAEGYRTAFFHGADNGSMGFQAYANAVGFQDYYGMDEYCEDPRHFGMDDFDGHWAIWDEEFLQYFAQMLDTISQPFLTTLFTASSHHPFNMPDRYRDSLHTEGHPLYTCIRYSDHALRQFFAYAKQQAWYKNTLFVITADHTNVTAHPKYQSALGLFRVPIIIFDPNGKCPPKRLSQSIAQQIDIMPTLMGLLHYNKPYLAFGKDLLATPADSTWAIHYNNGIYQYVHDSTLLLFDGTRVVAAYNYQADPLLHQDLKDIIKYPFQLRTDHMKAIIQEYMQRMIENRLIAETE